MSASSSQNSETFLLDLIRNGRLFVPEYGSQPAVGKDAASVRLVVEWIIENLGGTLPEGHELTNEAVQMVYVGGNLLKVNHVSVTNAELAKQCITMRADTRDTYGEVRRILCQTGNFQVIGYDSNRERDFTVLMENDLRFSIHLAWRKNPFQLPPAPVVPATGDDPALVAE